MINKNYSNSKEIIDIRKKLEGSFKGLHFEEDSHTYTLNGKELISTTTYLSRFSDSFNSYWASEAKSKKLLKTDPDDTRSGHYYRMRWKLIGNEASSMGTRVHSYAETFPYFDTPYCWREQAILDFYEWLPEKYIVLALELRIYDEDSLHAGTIDGVLYNTETGKLVLYDWKTNRRNINECYKGKTLNGDFKNMASTSLNKYTLQLSDYAYVIQKNTGFEIEDRWVVWLRNTPVNKKDHDRNDDYVIKRVKAFIDEPTFKVYQTKDVTSKIEKSYKKTKKELKKNQKAAKPKAGLFSKKENGNTKNTKTKSLFSKK